MLETTFLEKGTSKNQTEAIKSILNDWKLGQAMRGYDAVVLISQVARQHEVSLLLIFQSILGI